MTCVGPACAEERKVSPPEGSGTSDSPIRQQMENNKGIGAPFSLVPDRRCQKKRTVSIIDTGTSNTEKFQINLQLSTFS